MNNYERIRLALDDARAALEPFVESHLKVECGEDAFRSRYAVPEWTDGDFNADVQILANTIVNNWEDVFSKCMKREDKHLVHQVRKTRNRFAHQERFDDSDTYTSLHEIQRLMEAIGSDRAKDVEGSKNELLGAMAVDGEEAAKRAEEEADIALARAASGPDCLNACLVLIKGGRPTEMIIHFALPVVIGRSDPAGGTVDVDLSDLEEGVYVSRRHAKISVEDGAITLEDLGSSNGTYVLRGDYERIEKTEIVEGDEIALGNAKFLFKLQC